MIRAVVLAVSLAAAAGCEPSEELGAVIVEVQTDWIPGEEARSLRVVLTTPGAPEESLRSEARDLLGGPGEEAALAAGLRVAELGPVQPAEYLVVVELRRADGSELARRAVRLTHGRSTTGIRVVLSRDCAEIACPGTGPSELTECLGGRCVDPRCRPATLEHCPVARCERDAECPSAAPCASAVCAGTGVCLTVGDSSMCPPDQVCDPELGCRDPFVPMPDAGPPDTGPPMDAALPWDPDTDPDLVAWFRLDEADPSAGIADSSASGLSASCTGGCPTGGETGSVGDAYRFDGTNDRVIVSHDTPLVTAGGFTVSAWVRLSRVPEPSTRAIVAKPFGTSFRNSWELVLLDVDGDSEAELSFTMDSMTAEATASAEITIGANIWFLVAGTWDGAAARLYVAGFPEESVAITDPLFDSSDVLLGADDNGGVVEHFFEGGLDDVRIYRRALSAPEIRVLAGI